MRLVVPCLTVVAIAAAALLLAIYRADHPPKQVPTAPPRIVHIADWHWVPEDQYIVDDESDVQMTYVAFLDQLETIQQQQMKVIRELDVREVWIEGQSDETIAEFRQHVLKLRDFTPPDAQSTSLSATPTGRTCYRSEPQDGCSCWRDRRSTTVGGPRGVASS